MWRVLLPFGKLIGLLLFCLLFLISVLFLKPNIRTLNTFKDWARSPCNGNHFSILFTDITFSIFPFYLVCNLRVGVYTLQYGLIWRWCSSHMRSNPQVLFYFRVELKRCHGIDTKCATEILTLCTSLYSLLCILCTQCIDCSHYDKIF